MGDAFTCILKGYPKVLNLTEMKDLMEESEYVNMYRERRLACCMICVAFVLFILGLLIYWDVVITQGYDNNNVVILTVEMFMFASALVMGMCLFRWCSFNDVSPIITWKRVACNHASPLVLIKWNFESGDISYVEYELNYGAYPNALHEPIATCTRNDLICNAANLVKLTMKPPDEHDKESFGEIYFHFKGRGH